NDMTAAGLLYACKHVGLKVPEEVSICGFSGDAISETTDPLLTTVEQNGQEVGQCAFQLLQHRLTGQEHPGKMIVRTKLLLRGTTRDY
ncbi:MAG: substrate-binding domain-containing protein, partial [Bacteroidaceae bacterium]|nr:substrate-binding domain-containing protein [Bacteroidaceae bacterium]